jgi:hypothetical protein
LPAAASFLGTIAASHNKISFLKAFSYSCGRIHTVHWSLRLMIPKPQWVLTCNHCQKLFAHSAIPDARNLLEYFYPPKPAMPEQGQPLRCPHCHETGQYFQSDLRYQPALE